MHLGCKVDESWESDLLPVGGAINWGLESKTLKKSKKSINVKDSGSRGTCPSRLYIRSHIEPCLCRKYTHLTTLHNE